MMLITVHPEHVARHILSLIDVIIAIGELPAQTIRTFSEALDENTPLVPSSKLRVGEAIGWWRQSGEDPFQFRIIPPWAERRRHIRKYAEGELGPDSSFYFRGPQGKLNLRAQNLIVFMQLGDGVDDDTWMYHLRRGDYSRWFREGIKDEGLAIEVKMIEEMADISPEESRNLIKAKIEEYYTGPV